MGRILTNLPSWTWRKLQPWLSRPHWAWYLASLAIVLSSSALLLDLYLDDHVARYVYSDRDGAARLFMNHSGGFGFSLGDPVENHWLMEMGWAPWWLDAQMRFAGFRPLSVLSHTLDFRVLKDSPLLMHVHSLVWAGLMVLAVARMYRALLTPKLAAAAALLFALDYTHAFAIGYVMNRHALIGTTLGALALSEYFRHRCGGRGRAAWLGPLCYALGLLGSELTVSVLGYLLAFELLDRQDAWRKRARAAAPYLAITLVWLAMYKAAGFGAAGSDFYIDPGREPLHYLRAFLLRGPLLWLGQFSAPPAELYYEVSGAMAVGILAWAIVVVVLVVWMLWPSLRSNRTARFWFVGMLACLLPAAGPDANNRQLIFVSLGAMALIAQAWQRCAEHATAGRPSVALSAPPPALVGLFLAFRLFVSPALMPFMTASIGLNGPINRAAAAFASEPYANRDIIFVTTPYVYPVRVAQLFMRMADKRLPRHIRYISAGPGKTTLLRTGPRTLEVGFEGGLFSHPELRPERDPRLAMPPGTTVRLHGFQVDVLEARKDAGPTRVRVMFDRPLEDPSLAFYRWDERRFVPFAPPPVGARVELPGAVMPVGFE